MVFDLKDIMHSYNNFLKFIGVAAALVAAQSGYAADDTLIDAAYAVFATGTKTQMVRLGIESAWRPRWFESNGTHLGGYWDASIGAWRGNRYRDMPGQTQHLADIGFTPVFRFERDDKKGFYAEGGVGFHYLTKLYDNDGYRLSTNFEFGDHAGLGYVFRNNWALGMNIQHFSNGGIKAPNSGVNFIEMKVSRRF